MEKELVWVVCGDCGSELVTRDAWAEWDVGQQDWVLASVYDYAFCHACQQEARLEETPVVEDNG